MNEFKECLPLEVGIGARERLTVAPFHTVPELDDTWPGFRDMPPVLATAMMIGFVEQTCIEALRPYLRPQQRTVGTHVNVSHLAPTPVGMSFVADVKLVEINSNSLFFTVSCRDKAGLIGEGTHTRAIIDLQRFAQRANEKRERWKYAKATRSI